MTTDFEQVVCPLGCCSADFEHVFTVCDWTISLNKYKHEKLICTQNYVSSFGWRKLHYLQFEQIGSWTNNFACKLISDASLTYILVPRLRFRGHERSLWLIKADFPLKSFPRSRVNLRHCIDWKWRKGAYTLQKIFHGTENFPRTACTVRFCFFDNSSGFLRFLLPENPE